MQNKLSTDHVMRVTFAIWKPINLKLTVFFSYWSSRGLKHVDPWTFLYKISPIKKRKPKIFLKSGPNYFKDDIIYWSYIKIQYY